MINKFERWSSKKVKFGKPFYLIIITSLLLSLGGCKKMIEVDPPITSLVNGSVFESDATAIAAMTGIYSQLSDMATIYPSSYTFQSLSINSSLSSDELALFSTGDLQLSGYYLNILDATSAAPAYWRQTYNFIFQINSIIEGVTASTTLSEPVKKQLLGEARFLRAYCYFYLVNLYGNVPLASGTDPKINAVLSRSPKADVYQFIVSDLKEAESLLSDQYVSGSNGFKGTTTNRVRPSKWAASALLARTYLYQGQYSNAETEASLVINNTSLFALVGLNSVFLNNSKETIWQLQPLANGNYVNGTTLEGQTYILTPTNGPNASNTGGGYHPVYLSSNLLNSFEAGDDRFSKWIGSVTSGTTTYYFPYKYKVGIGQGGSTPTESPTVLRLGEVYLIRAEARSRLGKIAEAVADLNIIRARARAAATVAVPNPLPALPATLTQVQLYVAIEHERQVELFTELGHRWFDLKRTPGFSDNSKTRADEIMPSVMAGRNGAWKSTAQLFPIPQSELAADYNLVQNPGY